MGKHRADFVGISLDSIIVEGSCTGMPEVTEGKGCNWLTKGHTP
jgi:hypothetical protein